MARWEAAGGAAQTWGAAVFLSTFEKQVDGKRRIVVPQEFRAQTAGPFDGVFCFPSIEADCIEGGGKADVAVILEFDSPERAMEWYNSPAYQAILPSRLRNSTGRLICAAGVPPA